MNKNEIIKWLECVKEKLIDDEDMELINKDYYKGAIHGAQTLIDELKNYFEDIK